MVSFKGRYGPWAVVAGGSDGIGGEFARQLAALGLSLVLVARRSAPLEELAAELEGKHSVAIRALSLDLSRREEVDRLLEATAGLEIGLLVCNAAVSAISPFLDQPFTLHEGMLDLNCRMPLLLTHKLGRRMRAAGRGGIILLSSMAAFHGTPLAAHYAATKAYLHLLAEGIWAELRPFGVDVTAVCPATVDTPTLLREEPVRSRWTFPPTVESRLVVSEALSALGRKPVVVPGRLSRLASFVAGRLLSRKAAIALTARSTRAMYPAARGAAAGDPRGR